MSPNLYGSTDLDRAVAAEVRAEISRQKTSVSSLAQTLGVRRATLSARMNAHVAFTPSLLADVASVLGETASEFTRRAEAALADAEKAVA